MTDSFAQQWNHCKAVLRRKLEPEDAVAWLPGLKLVHLSRDKAVLTGIPNTFLKKRLLRQFQPLLRETIAANFNDIEFEAGFSLELRVGLNADWNDTSERADQKDTNSSGASTSAGPIAAGADSKLEATDRLSSHQTLETFQCGTENKSVWEMAKAVAERPGSRYNPFFLVGAVGLGKTHLLQGIARAVAVRYPHWRVVYRDAECYMNDGLEGIRERKMRGVRETYREADFLLIDGVSILSVSAKAQEELLHTFDALFKAGRQIVMASERYPRTIAGLNPALRSRLETGLIAELRPPGLDTRLAIVTAKAARDNISIEDESLRLLAERISLGPRRLEGALVRLAAYASMMQQPITTAFTAEFAAPFFDQEPQGLSLASGKVVMEAVCLHFGFTLRKLRSRDRSRQLDLARQVSMLLTREATPLSYGEIGAMLGGRTHATVIQGIRSLNGRLERSTDHQRTVSEIRDALHRSIETK